MTDVPRPVEKPAGRARKLLQVVTRERAGLRLDQFLAAAFPDELSRRKARTLIDIGGAFIDGRRSKQAGRLVSAGQRIEIVLGGAFERARTAGSETAPPEYALLFEDEDVVVVDKPAGLLTAPTPESDRNNLAYLLSRRAPGRPQPIFVVQRLDLQTSGVLVFGKTERANRELSELFRIHDVERKYFAVVSGVFPEKTKRISKSIAGRDALTLVEDRQVLGPGLATVLGLRLHTGRTHQIRIHCKTLGYPVLGDPGVRPKGPAESAEPEPGEPERPVEPEIAGSPVRLPRPPRMALHAAVLGFKHPVTGKTLRFEAPWPPRDLVRWLGRFSGA